MNWSLIGRTSRLAFVLRVPLVTLFILGVSGPVALNSSMVGNLLDQGTSQGPSGWYLFIVSFAAFLLAFTAVTTLNLILIYGSERFDEGAKLGLAQKRPMLTFICGCTTAVVLVICVYKRTTDAHTEDVWFLFLGCAAAFGLVILAKVIQLALTDPAITR